jgi:aminopeptidase-like protein/aminoglycoside N3'-acetyltransferase
LSVAPTPTPVSLTRKSGGRLLADASGLPATTRPEIRADQENKKDMSTIKPDYGTIDLVKALKLTGLCPGDVVFFQVSHLNLGQPGCGSTESGVDELLNSAMREVIGPEGTMLSPAFSFSFCKNEDFDVQATPSIRGAWSSSDEFLEYFRRLPGVVRSADPIMSVAGLGPMAEKLLSGLPNTSYGKDCLHERLLNAGGKICGIGVGLAETPFLHYVEEELGVPFRYKKLFTGRIRENGKLRKQGWIASVPISAINGLPDGTRLEKIVRSEGRCQFAKVGLGEVVSVDCRSFYELANRELSRDPWITARGPAGDPIEIEKARTNTKDCDVHIPQNASMEELISALWRLPRDIVSDGYDAALRALSKQVPMTVNEYPTGTECWTWLVPEKWTCHEAWLETMDGRRLFSYADNPLHVVSYSLPADREVSREELFEHLHVHPGLPDAIPFVFKYYERDWGLCCSKQFKDSLRDDRYRVVIKSEFSYGTLKVGEVIVPGKSSETFVLCAHLCHPAMVNDDLSGVAVGIKVIQELLKKKDLRYTYRFLILPETIGSAAYLSHHEELIPKMVGGLFLEMLGLRYPHALQLSFAGDTEMDRCLIQVLKESDPDGWVGPFRKVVGNDERQFNAPGVRVPMLSLSRVVKNNEGCWRYFPEYHSSHDTPELNSMNNLEASCNLVLSMIETIENNRVPINRFSGEVFCSRFGISVDPYSNPEGNRALFNIMDLVDGTHSVAWIASKCGISFKATMSVINDLNAQGLLDWEITKKN